MSISIKGAKVTGTHHLSPVKADDVITGVEVCGRNVPIHNKKDFLKAKFSTENNRTGWPKNISLVRGNTSMSVQVTRPQFMLIVTEDAELEAVYRNGAISLEDRKSKNQDLEETQELPSLSSSDGAKLDLNAVFGIDESELGEFKTVDAFRRLSKCDIWEDNQPIVQTTKPEVVKDFRRKLTKSLIPKIKEIEKRSPTMGPNNREYDVIWTTIIFIVLAYFLLVGYMLVSSKESATDEKPNIRRNSYTYSSPNGMRSY